ncbi:MAG: methyltransferase domain-containing protein [bacterium]|nr:methyltransferase domain-containing protein [bacterium]
MDNNHVAKYYDEALPYYKHLWSRKAHGIHYGFWDKETKSVEEAILNENKFLAEVAGIQQTDKVLDAGCGVGGSAIWIAENIGAGVVGITLSKKQLKEAKVLAVQHKVDSRVEFKIGDYLDTGLSDNTFDVVWAIESLCYAENKIDFLKEAYRVIKPGGRLVVADGFLNREVLKTEEKLYDDFLIGFVLSNLAKVSDFKQDMEKVGFKEINVWDKTINIMRSLRILYLRVLVGYPFLKLANFFGLVPDIVVKNGPTGIAQYKLFNSGLMKYEVFLGKK